MDIKQALTFLDSANDAHWTTEGLPLVGAVSQFIGRPVTRQEITAAAPRFNRDSRQLEGAAAPAPAPAPPAAPPTLAAALNAPNAPTLPGADQATIEADPGDEAEQREHAQRSAAEDEDAERLNQERMEDEALTMPFPTVLRSVELTERAWRALERQINAQRARVKLEQEKLDRLNAQTSALSRHLDSLRRTDPNASTRDIQQYLKTQETTRLARHERALAFTAGGTSAADVAELMSGKSKIDRSMERRKGHGNARPVIPPQHPPA